MWPAWVFPAPQEPFPLPTSYTGRGARSSALPARGSARGQAEGAPLLEHRPASRVPQRWQEPARYRLGNTHRDAESSLLEGSRTEAPAARGARAHWAPCTGQTRGFQLPRGPGPPSSHCASPAPARGQGLARRFMHRLVLLKLSQWYGLNCVPQTHMSKPQPPVSQTRLCSEMRD